MLGLRAILIGTVLFSLLLFLYQSHMIYFPPRHAADAPFAMKGRVDTITYQTGQGHQQAYWVPARADAGHFNHVWVIFGGNGACAHDWHQFVSDFPDEHTAFLLIDYPGYGANEGSPNPQRILRSTEGAITAVCAHIGVDQATFVSQLGLFGHSLGCAAALQYAAVHHVARVVIAAPFTSMLDMARRQVGWPLCEVLTHRFDNRARLLEMLRSHPPSLTILHGTVDSSIPVAMGRELAHLAGDRAVYIEVPGSDHNDLLYDKRPYVFAAMHW
jgi:pimeloyl-ACP methyl ester carboxylesterase